MRSRSGEISILLAYLLWGLFPIYWKVFETIPALEVSAHRVFWVLPTLIPILLVRRTGGRVFRALKDPHITLMHAFSAVCLVVNWLIYIWATINDHIIEAALGYYLNPFCYILAGRIFFKERQSRFQIVAISIAFLGVAYQMIGMHGFPWIAVTLAVSFAAYGVIRKQSPLGSFSGLTVESLVIFPFALAYLIWLGATGQGIFGHSAHFSLWLATTGVITSIPLLLFAYGTRRISLALLGVLQFMVPTMQFFLGAFYYHEPFPRDRAISFSLIWLAVILYIISLRKPRPLALIR